MKIRRAENRDIPDVLDLLVQVCMVHHIARPDLFNGPGTKYDAEQLVKIFADDSTPVFVATEEIDGKEKVVGHCFCIFEETPENTSRKKVRTLYIDDLSVDREMRGRKIGTALFEHVRSYAKASNCYNITLHVWTGNDPAAAFYDRCGMASQYTCLETIL